MRRISLALALMGAVAAAGCGGGTNSASGSNRGTPGSTFTLTVRQPTGGVVRSGNINSSGAFVADNRIVCGNTNVQCAADYAWDPSLDLSIVALQATPDTDNIVEGWAGDCNGTNVTSLSATPLVQQCVLSGKADKYVLVRFNTPELVTSHPNWSADPALHVAQVNAFALQCNRCHGLDWTGLGIAPSCDSCHALDSKTLHPALDPVTLATPGHFNATQEAWTSHTASGACVRCHTNGGFRDWVGLDGTANYLYNTKAADGTYPGTTTATVYPAGPLQCKTCHNSISDPIKSGILTINFPSGRQVTADPSTGLCGQCHQGRESTVSLNTKTAAWTTAMVDAEGASSLGFTNPHYLGAAATIFGTNAQGWYQYSGRTYTGTFAHGGLNSCTFCHEPHDPAQLKIADCGRCHAGVTDLATLESIRQVGFTAGDIDGNGTVEGLAAEVNGLGAMLYTELQAYSAAGGRAPICYNGAAYPYYFYDTNADGTCDAAESVSANGYKRFTPRMLRAAYNYKWFAAEPGAWAHNVRYVVEVLVDSINDLRTGRGLGASTALRSFAQPAIVSLGGHFSTTGAMEGHNSGDCARCHNNDAFRDYAGVDGSANYLTITYGGTVGGTTATKRGTTQSTAFATPGQFQCNGCHNPVTEPIAGAGTWTRQKTFPSGKTVTGLDPATALCAQCHDGGRPGYEVSQLMLQDPEGINTDLQLPTANNKTVRAHYLPAASTLFGSAAANFYQYPGMIYTGQNEHGGVGSCVSCHDPHDGSLPADTAIAARCGVCHFNEAGAAVSSFLQLEEARQFGFEGDIDGDGNAYESLKAEIDGLNAKLLEAIQAYASTVAGGAICQIDNRFYLVSNPADACGQGANTTAYNRYTGRLLRAAYNYLIVQNDVGAWAHNPRYTVEVVYDSIMDLNAGLGANAISFAGKRAFNGHFGGAEDASPYAAMVYHATAPQGFTSAACYQCHGGKGGFDAYVAGAPAALGNSVMTNKVTALQCDVCHVLNGTNMRALIGAANVPTVYFPPQKGNPPTAPQTAIGIASTSLPSSWAACGTCHSGRENGSSIDRVIANSGDPMFVTSFTKGPTNPHYLGAAAIILGTNGKMMYEYAGQTYAGYPVNWAVANNGNAPGPHGSPHGADCTGCHQPKASKHTFEVNYAYCNTCHTGQYSLAPVEEEFKARSAELFTAIQTYAAAHAADTTFAGICYNNASHPYFFVLSGTTCTTTQYNRMNPVLLKATFNYLWSQKEPGAWAHNEVYATQAIYDSIVDLGGTPSFTRP